MHVTYGFGIDSDVIGSYSVFGFGILELFPEGIITIVVQKIYAELRECIVSEDNRIYKIHEDN